MCEYCGCQNVGVIAELTNEHERLRNLGHELTRAANSGDLDAAQPLAAQMCAILGPHVETEERGLFPALAGEFGDQLDQLVEEHRSIDGTLSALAAGTPAAGWRGATHAALAHLFDHILKEQDGVFPAALATLSPADWDRAAAVSRATHTAPLVAG